MSIAESRGVSDRVFMSAGCDLPSPTLSGQVAFAFGTSSTLGIRNEHNFRGRIPTAHTLACLRIAGRVAVSVARLAPGWGDYPLRRAGFAPAGRLTEFHEFIAFSHSLRTSLSWPHYLPYVQRTGSPQGVAFHVSQRVRCRPCWRRHVRRPQFDQEHIGLVLRVDVTSAVT
jgi:hypothetical protein